MDVTRISACSFPLRERDLDYTFKVISEAGFDKIDLVGRMPHFSVTDPDYDMDELRRVCDEYGIALANIGSYCGRDFIADSEDDRQAAIDEMKKTLDVGQAFGSKSIRIMPGDGKRASIDTMVPYFQASAEYAEKLGIYMGIENHGTEISGNPEACQEICEKVDSKYFGILYEPCNLMAAGADYKSAFEVFKDYIVGVMCISRMGITTRKASGSGVCSAMALSIITGCGIRWKHWAMTGTMHWSLKWAISNPLRRGIESGMRRGRGRRKRDPQMDADKRR